MKRKFLSKAQILIATALVIVVLWINAVDGNESIREIVCGVTFDSVKCPSGKDCKFKCQYPCLKKPYTVEGTVEYSGNSQICTSAMHDLRISAWNSSARTVVVRRGDEILYFVSTTRYGITSSSPKTRGVSYHFVSPRITEEILDITSLHRNYLYLKGSPHTQDCYGATNAVNRKLSFRLHWGETGGWKGEQSEKHIVATWTDDKGYKTNGFICHADKNNVLSSVTSLAMKGDGDFLPESVTVTASVGGTATINMTSHGNIVVQWKKDLLSISSEKHMTERIFPSVQIWNTGFYSLHRKPPMDDLSDSAISRLVVRVCPEGIYGPSCNQTCPECKNGGICHDIMGTCICPPGFNGSNCEHACPLGSFARDCSLRCEGVNEPCPHILFCLPDPYGCSCGPGYKGPFCNTTCSPGEFGASCREKKACHCAGQQPCDIYTGLCPGRCVTGWHGKDCATSYPVLRQPLQLVNVTDTTLTVQFSEWNPEKDWGSGTPQGYILQHKKETQSSRWQNGRQLQAQTNDYKVILGSLEPDTDYNIRIIVVDTSSVQQKDNLTEWTFSTLCRRPREPPFDIKLNASSVSVKIEWKLPSISNWKCRNVITVLKRNGTKIEINDSSINHYEFTSKPYVSWSIEVCFGGKHALICAPAVDSTTEESAPSEVINLIWDDESQKANVSWSKPLEENGVIREYEVQYEQRQWHHNCPSPIKNNFNRSSFTNRTWIVLSDELLPSARYDVRVRAKTTGDGPWKSISVYTAESVPDSAPERLESNLVEQVSFRVTWREPDCSETNGKITLYRVTVTGLDPWSAMVLTETTPYLYMMIKDRIPYTTYLVKVYAGTEKGFSENYAHVNVTTKPKRPPAPTNLTIFQRTNDVLRFSWLPPYPPLGKLTEYKIDYGRGPLTNTKMIRVSEAKCRDDVRLTHHCYSITNLEVNKVYTIQVTARNEEVGWGQSSDKITGITAESTPGKPNSVSVESTEHSLIVNWTMPFESNGFLISYRINLTVERSFDSKAINQWSSIVEDVNKRSVTFPNLSPATTFTLTIEASTKVGYGPPLSRRVTTKNSVPIIETKPKLGQVMDRQVPFILPSARSTGAPISAYFVIVEIGKCRDLQKENFTELQDYNMTEEKDLRSYITAKFHPSEFKDSYKNFTIGDGLIVGGYYNAPLVRGRKYTFQVAVMSNFSGDITIGYECLNRLVEIRSLGSAGIGFGSGLAAGIGIMIVLIIFLGALLYIVYRKPHLYKTFKHKSIWHVKKVNVKDEVVFSASTNTLDIIETESLAEVPSECIKVSELESYVSNMASTGCFRQQYLCLPKGQNASWEIAKRPESRGKNRYGNLLAYDHTRVVLEKLPNDPSSDYINANYVDGYKKPRKYIATQGPKLVTINDFWRMVWQEEVCKIVMATNVVENEKVKCEKYWPDTTENYQFITVSNINTEVYADFTIRTLQISKCGKNRIIKHFHFTTWPDHGVPMYSTPVISFIRLVRGYQPSNPAPFVVHCSAGIGRTGTLILLDSMLDMAEAEDQVDLPQHLHAMRQQRISIVENLDQYIFVYQALVEALCEEETGIKCSELIPVLNKMKIVDPSTRMTVFEQQLQKLNKRSPQLSYVDCRTAHETVNQEKNRTKEIVPPDRARPMIISSTHQGSSDYINAVFVDGYRQRNAFVVTQLPLANTVADFWQLVCQTDCKTIILLHSIDIDDVTCHQYWSEGAALSAGNVFIQHLSTEVDRDIVIRTFIIRSFHLQNTESSMIVKQFHLHNWHPSEPVPSSAQIILDLMRKVEKWQQQSGLHLITVQCYNGVCGSGLYCASAIICDTIKSEQVVDVFLAVRRIRRNRPQFIQNLNQYTFLYDIALAYLDLFQTYANFQ